MDHDVARLAQICRTIEIQGRTIPGVIRNGVWYHLTSLRIYEDGLVDCWKMVDLAGLAIRISEGWLVPAIPAGGMLGIHHLGSIEIGEGSRWEHTADELHAAIVQVVQSMNPDMTSLFDTQGLNVVASGTTLYTWPPTGKPHYRAPAERGETLLFQNSTMGHGARAIANFGSFPHLVEAVVFADDKVRLYGGPEIIECEFDELVARVRDTDDFLPPDFGSTLRIKGLGDIVIGPNTRLAGRKQLIGELQDKQDEAKNRPTAPERCAAAFRRYQANPNRDTRKSLRDAYEATPRHLRMYCGSMDEKDGSIREVLYGEEDEP